MRSWFRPSTRPLLGTLFILTAAACSDEPAPIAAQADAAAVRSIVQRWYEALTRGDTNKANELLVDDPVQRAFVDDYSRFAAAIRRLEATAVEKFGESAKQFTGYPDPSAFVGEPQVQIDGDLATMTHKDAMLPLNLRRQNGHWRIDLAQSLSDPRARDISRKLRDTAQVMEQLADEIAAGQFANVQDARGALDLRRRQALSGP